MAALPHTFLVRASSALIVLLFLPMPAAQANAGLPMIGIFLPPMWLALLPIVALEAFIIARMVDMPLRPTFIGSAVANVASSVVGVPLVWCLLLFGQIAFMNYGGLNENKHPLLMAVLGAAWIGPAPETGFYWKLPVALMVLAVPFFLLSVVVETPIVRRIARIPPAPLRKAVLIANLASYAGLGLLIGIGAYFDWSALFYLGPVQPVVDWILNLIEPVLNYLAPRP